MSPRAREVETLLLTMFAAVPLYATQTISATPLLIFHTVMAGIALRVAFGKSPELIPAQIMRTLALMYIAFYVVDAAMLSHSAIAASTHLVLFIAVYQPIESLRADNRAQRLLTTSLIFIASIATSTHISIILYVLAFAFLMQRQLMSLSHQQSIRSVGLDLAEPPSAKAAAFYLCGTALVGALLFPLLPRIRNPFVQGVAGALNSASTGLSDSIDFNQPRTGSTDPAVVARVWMGQEAIPLFTPLRLRSSVYNRFVSNEWQQGGHYFLPAPVRNGVYQVAQPSGFTRQATIQQRLIIPGGRLFLPVGTWGVGSSPQVYETPARDVFSLGQSRRDLINYEVTLARSTRPLRETTAGVTNYPVTPEVAALADQIAGSKTRDPMRQAAAIERYLATRYEYIPDPSKLGHTMTVDEFLLKEKRGHCEYFAAGMVALLTALNVPARIAGGFYGGQLNPLTGYFVIRREDAHAWVEVWNGERWETFDPTPPLLRPGNTQSGLLRAYASALSESVNYFWDRYVLTYGLGDQIAFAAELINRARAASEAIRESAGRGLRFAASRRIFMPLGVALAAAAATLFLLRRRRPMFDLLAGHLGRLGIDVDASTTMQEALDRLRARSPEAAAELEPLIELYEAEAFSGHPEPKRRSQLRRRLAELAAG
ncbi:MAG TPA: DUF3488 and DUF4129 domain-containing transglutaminase family protein [Thermoanaerobaculia bacterium]|nr:DUF3488 and DUF4129 domain-containing transglutaminase family protein [Thermoanaerobaculia bacterium]